MFRLETMPCELTLRYQEKVSLNPSVADPPQIPETDYPTLSEEVLPYLHPSRYCESERLASFAMAKCGGLDCGYSRVAAVVNGLTTICKHLGQYQRFHRRLYCARPLDRVGIDMELSAVNPKNPLGGPDFCAVFDSGWDFHDRGWRRSPHSAGISSTTSALSPCWLTV